MTESAADYLAQAKRLIEDRQPAAAVTVLNQALALAPDESAIWSLHGLLHEEMGELETALASFRRSTGITPTFCDHYNAGNMLLALKRPQEAFEEFDRSVNLRSDYPEAWVNRGIALHALSRQGDAGASFEQALRIDPDFAPALRCQAILLAGLGEPEKAGANYRRLTELQPDNPSTWFEYGCALRTLPESRSLDLNPGGRLRTALHAIERAIALDPDLMAAYAERIAILTYLTHGLSAVAKITGRPGSRANPHSFAGTLAELRRCVDDACQRFPADEWFSDRREAVEDDFGECVSEIPS